MLCMLCRQCRGLYPLFSLQFRTLPQTRGGCAKKPTIGCGELCEFSVICQNADFFFRIIWLADGEHQRSVLI